MRTRILAVAAFVLVLAGCSASHNPTAPDTATTITSSDTTAVGTIAKPGAELNGGTYANQQWWRGLGQAGRNEQIVWTAYNHMLSLGGNYNKFSRPSGYVCKTWIQQYVVPTASRYVASIPASNGWCRWVAGTYVSIVGYGPTGVSINGAVRGNIVQASWGSYPHTMIVYQQISNGVIVIDCNYDLRGGLEMHFITYADFEKISGGCYTVYQVTGG